MLALDAELGFERVMTIVETCVDDLALYQYEMKLERLKKIQKFQLTSELRLLVSVPTDPCLSIRIVEVPSLAASCRAIARPTAPAPIT